MMLAKRKRGRPKGAKNKHLKNVGATFAHIRFELPPASTPTAIRKRRSRLAQLWHRMLCELDRGYHKFHAEIWARKRYPRQFD
jgi:hypothetical protein